MKFGGRHTHYGKLNVKSLDPEVYRIWKTRNDELDELPVTLDDVFVSDDFLIEARSTIKKIFEFGNFTTKEIYSIIRLVLHEATYEQVGTELGLSKERVRQIYSKAIRKAKINFYRAQNLMQEQRTIYKLKAKNDKNLRTTQTA